MTSKQNLSSKPKSSQFPAPTLAMSDDDDDFQNPSQAISLTQNLVLSSLKKPTKTPNSQPLKPSNSIRSKKPKRSVSTGKENIRIPSVGPEKSEKCSVSSSIEPREVESSLGLEDIVCSQYDEVKVCQLQMGSSLDLIESRISDSCTNSSFRAEDIQFSENVRQGGGLCENEEETWLESDEDRVFSLESPEPDIKFRSEIGFSGLSEKLPSKCDDKNGLKMKTGYLSNSIESRLLAGRAETSYSSDDSFEDDDSNEESFVDFDPGTQLNDLIRLCSDRGDGGNQNGADFPEGDGSVDGLVGCPLCGLDLSNFTEEMRLVHTNECLDKNESHEIGPSGNDTRPASPQRVSDVSPVLEWLRGLGLSRYEEAFVKEEVDWDTLKWLTEEDLLSIGVTALGPRKKIIHALKELQKNNALANHGTVGTPRVRNDETKTPPGNMLITEFFPGSSVDNRKREQTHSLEGNGSERRDTSSARKRDTGPTHKRDTSRNSARKGKSKDIPSWCSIPGTPFQVDAFRYLRGDCSHWFLTHFHIDHYQGLTKSFRHGKIYCSSITAQLVNMKIGITWDKLQVLPLNQKICIAGVDVTCLDANHCPGAIIILFEPPNGKSVLHTGDFRFSEEMEKIPILQSLVVHTLILDTTYCNPQYDFPKQEAVIQFVIESIQAEAFNPKTLFLIGSYTIGKERLFIEVARCLQKKIYVGAAKMHTLRCLELPEEDMKWFTSNEKESHIHVVPLWTIASFKRMKHISNQYSGRFSSIVAFSPTGWSFGKGKKKSQGRRWQQGTVIRYEVPYSEHSSFTELKEFVQFISPEKIIPSVNNNGPESVDAMIAMLKS